MSRSQRRVCLLFLCVWVILAISTNAVGGPVLLHKFAGGANDGRLPETSLTLVGSTLYGTTRFGGDSDMGTVFKVNTDGSGFQLLHKFAGGVDDGRSPRSGLTLVGTALYGTTLSGGDSDRGTIFKLNPDGSGFQLVHKFAGSADGTGPSAPLTFAGSTLYGTAAFGGSQGWGTAFKLNVDGSGFQVMHDFDVVASGGGDPRAELTPGGGFLYGTTQSYYPNAPPGGGGAIFQILNTGGTGYGVLHTFSGPDGNLPSSLTLAGSTLYGTTATGGSNVHGTTYGDGTIFKLNSAGSGFQLLHNFGGTSTDGSSPMAGLTLAGSTLYGTTYAGGNLPFSNGGTIFKINIDGSDYQVLYVFTGGATDGLNPSAALTLSGSTLYGTTTAGGSGGGTVFALQIPEPGGLVLALLGTVVLVVWGWYRRTPSAK